MEGEGKWWYVRNVPGADNPFPLGAGCCAEPTSEGRGWGLLLQSEMEDASETQCPGSQAGESPARRGREAGAGARPSSA